MGQRRNLKGHQNRIDQNENEQTAHPTLFGVTKKIA